MSRSSDSYLKSLPPSGPYQRRIARYRQKGYHAETVPGDGNELDASAVYPITPVWGWSHEHLYDSALNDSDKTVVVPDEEYWELLGVYAQLHASADAGNRYLRCDLLAPSGLQIAQPYYTAAIAANLYGGLRQYFGAAIAPYTTVFTILDSASTTVNVALTVGVGRTILNPRSSIRVWDSAAVAPAADDLIVSIDYIRHYV